MTFKKPSVSTDKSICAHHARSFSSLLRFYVKPMLLKRSACVGYYNQKAKATEVHQELSCCTCGALQVH